MILKKMKAKCKCLYTNRIFRVDYVEYDNMSYDPFKKMCCPCCGEDNFEILNTYKPRINSKRLKIERLVNNINDIYFTDELIQPDERYRDYKYFLVYMNTHKVYMKFKTLDEVIEELEVF